jgi:alpha-L-fucosidase
MFIHWTPNVYLENGETDPYRVPIERINPYALDTEQWVDAAVAMGAKYIVFVAKHVTGFCHWATDTTDYSISGTPWRGGRGDIMRDLSASCAKRGIDLGVYLSPRDDHHGAKVSGICTTPEKQAAYADVYRRQLTELLSRYGDICEVWFDGSLEFDVGDILTQYAPDAMVFQSEYATIRWVGNEDGIATYPAWNTVSSEDGRTGGATNRHGDASGDMWMPLECDARITYDWFWSPKSASTLKSLDDLMEMYYRSVGNGAVLLLNHTPDRTGAIPAADVERGAEFGREVARRFGDSASLAYYDGPGDNVELHFDEPTEVDHVIAMEDIADGERVRAYTIEGLSNGVWTTLASGTAIGHKKIDRFPATTVESIRFRVLQSVGLPTFRQIAAYATGVPYTDVAATSATSVQVGEWGSEIFYGSPSTKPQTLDFDITGACPDAREYEVAFVGTRGTDKISVDSLSLVHHGEGYTKYIAPTDDPLKFIVTITEVNDTMRVRAAIHSDTGTNTFGKVLVTPMKA